MADLARRIDVLAKSEMGQAIAKLMGREALPGLIHCTHDLWHQEACIEIPFMILIPLSGILTKIHLRCEGVNTEPCYCDQHKRNLSEENAILPSFTLEHVPLASRPRLLSILPFPALPPRQFSFEK